jgi:hypothetical protein
VEIVARLGGAVRSWRELCRGAGVVLLLALAGCGSSSSHSTKAPPVRISRPGAPVWCPRTGTVPPGSFDVRRVLGLPESDAAMSIARHGCKSRVVARDGQSLAVTADFVPNRIDLTIQHDIVTAIRTS